MNERDQIYDEISRTLTDYENSDEVFSDSLECSEALYFLLCKIQNNWEIITAEH